MRSEKYFLRPLTLKAHANVRNYDSKVKFQTYKTALKYLYNGDLCLTI